MLFPLELVPFPLVAQNYPIPMGIPCEIPMHTSTLEAIHDKALYKFTFTLLSLLYSPVETAHISMLLAYYVIGLAG